MQRTLFFLRLLFVTFVTAIIYTLTCKWVDRDLAVFSLPLSLVFLHWCHLAIVQPWWEMRSLSRARIELNLEASRVRSTHYRFKNHLNILLLAVALGMGASLSFQESFLKWGQYALRSLLPTQAKLSVEAPSYARIGPKEYALSTENTLITTDTESYLKLRLENADGVWSLSLNSNGKKQQAQLSATGLWSTSTQALYTRLQTNTTNERPPLSVTLELSNGKKTFHATLALNPTPKPDVVLEQVSPQRQAQENAKEKLAFGVAVQSVVPLSLIELSVRTKSGYQFKKTLGEFTNDRQEQFRLPYTELLTAGIPFQSDDILYVKAVAKTVLAELVGESKELSFPIQTPMQIRQEVIQKLERALANLKKGGTKENILKDLQESKEQLGSMSKYGSMQRNLSKAMEQASASQRKQDAQSRAAQAQIQKVLDMLKRQQKNAETINFIYQLQKLNADLNQEKNLDNKETHAQEADKLQVKAQKIHRDLTGLAKLAGEFLEPEEKKLVQTLLQADKTAQNLNTAKKALGENNLPASRAQTQMALDSAVKNLSGAAQILSQARARAIAKAKKHLNAASDALEHSIQESSSKEMEEFLKEGTEHLQQTPIVNEEMMAALGSAKKNTEESKQAVRQKKWDKQLKSAQNAQNDIERALLSLEDEEQNEQQSQREQEERNYRASMDILSAQGQLDASWRKKILEEIARLKKQGTPSDDPMIQYLESRLR